MLLVYLISKRIWNSLYAAIVAAFLYGLASDSLFFAVSLWYHPLYVFCFLIASYSLLVFSENKQLYNILFCFASAVCITIKLYTALPLAVLALGLPKVCRKTPLLVIVLLSVSNLAYNHYMAPDQPLSNKGIKIINPIEQNESIIDSVFRNVERFTKGFILSFINRRAFPEYGFFYLLQKAVLTYMPYLIFSLAGFLALKKKGLPKPFPPLLLSIIIYSIIVVYTKTNSFGGWELSMRYLMPVTPILLVLAAGYIVELLDYRLIILVIAVSAIFAQYIHVMYFDYRYESTLWFSLLLVIMAVVLLILGYVLRREFK